MRYVFLILFLFLFLPTASFAKTYPYTGKTALLSDSIEAGGRHDWLRLCAGKYSKHAREIEKEVKRILGSCFTIRNSRTLVLGCQGISLSSLSN